MRGLYKIDVSPYWHIRYADEHGRIIRASTGTTNLTLAKSILGKRKLAVVENRHLDIQRFPTITFHALCDEYWKRRGSQLKARGLIHCIDSFKGRIGNVTLMSITQKQIEDFLDDWMKERKFSVGTRNTYLMRLKAIFSKAVEWGMLRESPASGVENLRGQESRTRFLTVPEIVALLAAASKRFRPLLVVALHTGMRRGEIFRLHWSDVDFQNRIITVQRRTKNGKNRAIPMDDTLISTLKELPSRFAGELVFPSQITGKELRYVDRIFTRLLKKAKIENFTFHDLRHTFASHLVMSGVDLAVVRDLLGHSTVRMTERYAHLAPEFRVKAVQALDSAYAKVGL